MDSRIKILKSGRNENMVKNGTVMYYLQDENKRIQLEVLCMGMSLNAKQIKVTDLNTQVGILAGIKGIKPLDRQNEEKAPAIFCMPEVLIFAGVSQKTLDEFLASYKRIGLEPVKLKAMTTPKNVEWTLYHLVRELAEECRQIEAAAARKNSNK